MAARVAVILALSVIWASTPAAQTERPFPPTGVATEHREDQWCLEVSSAFGTLAPGSPLALVFSDPVEAVVWTATLGERLAGQCETAFPQPRWVDYSAYALVLSEDAQRRTVRTTVGFAVIGEFTWRRGPTGQLRADLDGDGTLEEARRCAAGEGEHFTLWSLRPGGSERRAHEYFDWGAIVEATCTPGDDGR